MSLNYPKRNDVMPFLAISAICLFILLPLITKGFPITDDGAWMIIRLSAFYQSFREGQFPVRFIGRLNNGYGYPVSNFLYPGFLYLGSFLHVIGFSFISAIKVIIAGSIFGSTYLIYLSLLKQFDRFASLTGSLLFILTTYISFDIYTRGSVGEIFGLFAVAFVVYCISINNVYLLSLAVGLLTLSHNTIAFFTIIILFSFVIFFKKWYLLKSIFLGIGIAAFFWIPAIYEQKYVRFPLLSISNPSNYFIWESNLFLFPFIFFISAFVAIYIKLQENFARSRIFALFIFFLTIFLVLPVGHVIWSFQPFARIIQFPYRLLIFTIFFGTWLITLLFSLSQNKYKTVFAIIVLGVSILLVIPQLSNVKYLYYADGYYTTNQATTTVSDEYMPTWVKKSPQIQARNRLEVLHGAATIVPNIISTQKINVDIQAMQESTLQINTVYYPGWGIVLDGIKLPIQYDNEFGVMQVNIPEGKHNLVAEFRETGLRFIADCISLICIISVFVLWILNSRKLPNNRV